MDQNKTKRFRYVLKDIEEARAEGLVPHEILLGYENNDFIIIDEELNECSLIDYIKKMTSDYIKTSHLKSSNQHPVVSEKSNGFMTSDLFKTLRQMKETTSNIDKLIDSFIGKAPYFTKLVEYNESNNHIKVLIEKGMIDIAFEETMILADKPPIGFVNRYNVVGFRDDIIVIRRSEEGYHLEYITDVYYSDTYISNEFKYDKETKSYTNGIDEIIPLIKIRRMSENSDFSDDISIVAPYKLEPLDVDRVLEENRCRIIANTDRTSTKMKQIKTNVVTDTSNAVLYIGMNGNDKDSVSGSYLNKNIIYKKSPFGKMMKMAMLKGDYISFKKQTDFILEFMLNGEIKNGELITLLNSDIKSKICVAVLDNLLIVNDIFICPIFDNQLSFITLNVSSKSQKITVYFNNVYAGECELHDFVNVEMISVDAINNSIGEILITNNLSYKNKLIDSNVTLVSNDNLIFNRDYNVVREREFKVTDTNLDDMCIITEHKDVRKLSKGDKVTIYFNNYLVEDIIPRYTIRPNYNITNKVTIPNHDFKVNDVLAVFSNMDVVYGYYIVIDIIGDDIYLDKSLPEYVDEYYINNINDTDVVHLTLGDKEIKNIICGKSTISFYVDSDILLTETFKIKYIERIKAVQIFNDIVAIDNVKVNDKLLDKLDSFVKLDKFKLSMVVNDIKLTNDDKTNDNIVRTDKNGVKLSVNLKLKDFISFDNIPFDILTKVLSVRADARLAYIGDYIDINGKKYHSNNEIMCNYEIENILFNEDGDINITIFSPESLILNDINITLRLGGNDIFVNKNNAGTIVEFVVVNKNVCIVTNITKPLTINFKQRQNTKYIGANHTIYEKNQFKLVATDDNIVKITDSDNNVYNPNKKYVL